MHYKIKCGGGILKKVVMLLLSLAICLGLYADVYGGELNQNEQYIIDRLSEDSFPAKLEQRYINQLKNYFCRESVSIEKTEGDDFLEYLTAALKEKQEIDAHGMTFDRGSSIYKSFEKAGTSIGLLLEYDSEVNDFYAIDNEGYIVIDTQDIIKNTDSGSQTGQNWNISIEAIFSIAIVICILGIMANLRRWNRKMKRRNKKNYEDDDEDDDELEIANRKTRKARLQTFSYKSVKQVLKYFYVPIIMGLIVVAIGFALSNINKDLRDSISQNFINTQPLYNQDEEGFIPITVKETDQKSTISISNVAWPKYGEQYGSLTCEALNINAPVYFGDRDELLQKGAGSYIGSSIPGAGSTILLGAHDTTYFKGLEKAKKGDEFIFTTEYGIYRYTVTNTVIADEEQYNQAYELNSENEQLILYTCYPFGTLNGAKTERMFVYLDKVSGPDIE